MPRKTADTRRIDGIIKYELDICRTAGGYAVLGDNRRWDVRGVDPRKAIDQALKKLANKTSAKKRCPSEDQDGHCDCCPRKS